MKRLNLFKIFDLTKNPEKLSEYLGLACKPYLKDKIDLIINEIDMKRKEIWNDNLHDPGDFDAGRIEGLQEAINIICKIMKDLDKSMDELKK